MREIGGYIELDTYKLPLLHKEALALNCGRNALIYLLRSRNIKKLFIPKLICASVTRACERSGVDYELYGVGTDFLPAVDFHLKDGEWLYLVNYYSQLDNGLIAEFVNKYGRVIVDNAQSYFQQPIAGVDTLYTCRKYFGVPDGAFLYTEARLSEALPVDESFERMRFLLGRFERTASEFYAEYAANNDIFDGEPLKEMSKLTKNLLRGIDCRAAEGIRRANYEFLCEELADINMLKPAKNAGTFMYPLMIKNGAAARKALQKERIYIPTLWPDVFEWCKKGETEYEMAQCILPLPIDQRYGREEMEYLTKTVKKQVLNAAVD